MLPLFPFSFQVPSLEEVLEDENAPSSDPCVGKSCTANEHCCDGHVCVDTEDDAQSEGENNVPGGQACMHTSTAGQPRQAI